MIEASQRHGPLDAVLQLAHVARPGVAEELVGSGAREPDDGPPALRGVAPHEASREKQDVASPLAQRRHVHAHHVDAVVQIFAEAALLDRGLEIAVGRGDDAGVEGELLVAADGPDRPLLQDSQELHLHAGRQLTDLVEEDRPPPRLHEETRPAHAGVGERAFDVPE